MKLDCDIRGIIASTETDFSVGSDGTLKADAVETQHKAMNFLDRISELLGKLFGT